jgi:hypothetical protein
LATILKSYREGETMRTILAVAALVGVAGLAAAQDKEKAKHSETEQKAMAQVRQLGGLAMDLAQNDSHVEVSYPQSSDGKFTDKYLEPLKDLKGSLVHLNLRGQPVTDDQLAHLKDLTGLTELHLERTQITDKGLVHLKGLVNLEYLNLYGTNVSDAGLANLEGMKKLKHLYLWQSKATKAGADKLKKAIPQLDVNLGIDLSKPPETAKPEPKPEPKKDDKKPEKKKDEKKPEPKKEDKKPEKKDDKKPEPKKEDKKPEPKKDEKKK